MKGRNSYNYYYETIVKYYGLLATASISMSVSRGTVDIAWAASGQLALFVCDVDVHIDSRFPA